MMIFKIIARLALRSAYDVYWIFMNIQMRSISAFPHDELEISALNSLVLLVTMERNTEARDDIWKQLIRRAWPGLRCLKSEQKRFSA